MIDIEIESKRILKSSNLSPRLLAFEIKDLIKKLEEEKETKLRQFKLELMKAQCRIRL